MFSLVHRGPDYIDGSGGLDTLVDFSRADLAAAPGVTTNANRWRGPATTAIYAIERMQVTGASKNDQIHVRWTGKTTF
ncbi:MAG: hypothetical protein R3F11_18860 [Verrucomicrobiales bacterium]